MQDTGTIKDHGHLKPEQISQDEYFMDICRVVGEKGTCDRGRSGCVIVKDGKLISTGYVNAPHGNKTCDEVGHQLRTTTKDTWETTEHCMRNCCAEVNAIANASRQWVSLEGATLYTKMTPCYVRHCVHLIVSCGISRVVCEKKFHDAELSEQVLKNAGIELTYLESWVEKY